MKDKLTRLKFNALAAAWLYVGLGLVLIIWPDASSSIICYAIGAVLLVCGIVAIVSFLLNKDRESAPVLSLAVGVVALLERYFVRWRGES